MASAALRMCAQTSLALIAAMTDPEKSLTGGARWHHPEDDLTSLVLLCYDVGARMKAYWARREQIHLRFPPNRWRALTCILF